jgi:pimeloyl-ACP methyl ester carboxylesterase
MPALDVPDTRYAKTADGLDIAYQVFGAGPWLMGIPGFAQNIEVLWEEPQAARLLRRLGSFSRFIHFDKRGTGLSDRSLPPATLEERADDLRAVMDAEGIDQAFIGGFSEGGLLSAYFAATHPDRVAGLILLSTGACFVQKEDHPWNPTEEVWRSVNQQWAEGWGTGQFTVPILAPSVAGDAGYQQWAARYERQSLNPGAVLPLQMLNAQLDIRHLLPTIRVPTLVLHRRDEIISVENGRYLAAHIPGARLKILDGADHLPWIGDQDSVLDEMEEFVSGTRVTRDVDRVLATVLFTDIVGSTEILARTGDREWRGLLDAHDAAARREVGRYGGRLIKTTGDGILATFDGPGRAIRCAAALSDTLADQGLNVRIGLHTGEIEIIGDDVGGIAVHIAARVMAHAGAGEVVVSSSVPSLVVGSGIEFEDRGEHELKGVPGTWRLFAVAG